MKQTAVFVTLVVVVAGCATGSSFVNPTYDLRQIDRTAVSEVTGANNNEAAQNEVADLFAMELMKRGFNPIERTQVQALLNEQDFQKSELTSAMDVAAMGRILNVDAIMVVNVSELGEQISLTAKMIEVETGTLLWMGEGTGRAGTGFGRTMGAVTGGVIGGAVGHQAKSGIGTAIGAGVGALAGHQAGKVLEPTQKKALRKVVGKVAESMPTRF